MTKYCRYVFTRGAEITIRKKIQHVWAKLKYSIHLQSMLFLVPVEVRIFSF